MTNEKTIIVTGGLGYIGSHVCIALHEEGFIPVIIDDLSNAHKPTLNNISQIMGGTPDFYQINLCHADLLKEVLRLYKGAAVIHLAAKKSVEESVQNPLEYYQSNLGSLLSLLSVMNDFDMTAMVYSSSATVYAPTGNGFYQEDAEKNPCNPYGWTKLMGERIITDQYLSGNLCAASLRYFNPVGAHHSGLIGDNPKGKANNLMAVISEVVRKKRDYLMVYGDDYNTPDGTAIRDYVHICDVADAHVAAIKALLSHRKNFTVNIGTGQGISVKEMVTTYEDVNNIKIPHKIGSRRAGDAEQICAKTDLAQTILGWKSRHTLKDMCRDSHRWVQAMSNQS